MCARGPVLAGAVLLGLSFSCSPPALASLPFEWDLRMGPSLTGAASDLADRLDRAGLGIEGGIGIRVPRLDRIPAVQWEFLSVRRVRSFEDPDVSRRRLQIHYAQTNLLAYFALRPYFVAGPYFAWRLSSRVAPGTYVGDEPVDPAQVRARNAGAIVGLGADVPAGSGRASFEVRLNLGLVNVLDSDAGVEGTFRVLTIMMAFNPSR